MREAEGTIIICSAVQFSATRLRLLLIGLTATVRSLASLAAAAAAGAAAAATPRPCPPIRQRHLLAFPDTSHCLFPFLSSFLPPPITSLPRFNAPLD